MADYLLFSFAAVMVLLVPGAALLAWLPGRSDGLQGEQRDLLSWLSDALGISVSLTVLIGLWLFFSKLRLPPAAIAGLYAAGLLALLAAAVREARAGRIQRPRWWKILAALALIVGLVAWRLYQARSLALPAWVDSVHHTLIIQQILATGGLPADYGPYIDAPFFYHYGFHLITALFSFFSRLPADRAVLWFGQVINACVALSIYRAAYAFGDPQDPARRTARAYLAALIVGLAMQMPAYYLTWGRYTLLSGLLLLGPTLAAAYWVWNAPRRSEAWLRLALLIGGLGVTHYFALLLVVLFLAALGLVATFRWIMDGRVPGALWVLAGLSVLGVMLAAPWLARIWVFSRSLASVQVVDPLDQSSEALKRASDSLRYLSILLGPRHSHILMGVASLGLLAALRRAGLRVLVIWSLLLVAFTLPWGLRLGPFRPDHYAIVLFFPASILLSELLITLSAALGALVWKFRPSVLPVHVERVTLSIIALALLLWGARQTKDIVNPTTVIGTSADVAALNWVQANTPPDARFYINSVGWMSNTYRGTDGGYWLEPYTGRFSLIPPALYIWNPPAVVIQINQWAERSGKLSGCTDEFWNIVREAQLTYVYLRQGTGTLQPDTLSGCERLQPVYQKDGVFIYTISPAP